MRYAYIATVTALITLSIVNSVESAETGPVAKTGIRSMRLVCDRNSISPGETFSVGLYIQHSPEYHTYWKAPGIVGLPTSIDWVLPPGFDASDLEWPVPELTKMAQYTAYGYERDVCLLTKITVPQSIDSANVTLKAKVAFMCCAKTCHPGWHDFQITLPVIRSAKPDIDEAWSEKFDKFRNDRPETAPDDWSMEAWETEKEIKLEIRSPHSKFAEDKDVYCYCEDNRIDSDKKQSFTWSGDGHCLTITLTKSGFGPENLKKFSGLLYHGKAWPDNSSQWVRISVPFSPT
ncbi:MAG: protein-disulfide reductase DsbD family protein [Verrucomicrobiales bacterium]|nr:protein-disulfide reductase DsbD family protein [Verrucomicrobiales bacterium]